MPFLIRPYPLQFADTYKAYPFLKLPLAYLWGFGSLIMLLVLSSGTAYAEWVEITNTGAEGYTLYVDPDSIRRKKDLVKMWILEDYNLAQRVPDTSTFYLSIRLQEQFDCAEELVRGLVYTYFSGNMAEGDVVVMLNSDEGKWSPVAPGTIGRSMWEVGCRKQ